MSALLALSCARRASSENVVHTWDVGCQNGLDGDHLTKRELFSPGQHVCTRARTLMVEGQDVCVASSSILCYYAYVPTYVRTDGQRKSLCAHFRIALLPPNDAERC